METINYMMVTKTVNDYIKRNLIKLTRDLIEHLQDYIHNTDIKLDELSKTLTAKLNLPTVVIKSDFDLRFSDRISELYSRIPNEQKDLLARVVIDKANRDMDYIDTQILDIVAKYKLDIDDFITDITKYIRKFKRQVNKIIRSK
jgi:hypothetical protein